jgi:hypothetical protein
MRPPFSFPQIATGDLNIAVVGQLPSTNLPFGDQFEPRPVKVVRFEAAFRCRSLWKQDLENAPGHADDTLIVADAYTELDDGSLGVPASIGRKAKEHGPPRKRSANVLLNMPRGNCRVDSALFREARPKCHGATDERCFADMRVDGFCRSGLTAAEKIGQTRFSHSF